MRINDIVNEQHKALNKKTKDLSETINLTESRTYKLWESAGRKIIEAQLTPAQIQQLFQQAEQGATAAGGNRTMIGQGKDVAIAVNKAWDDLKTKVQNSGPIQGIDAKYDQAAEKLKQATGGDTGVMQYIQKYRDFAKKHPIAQSLIYSALIAAAGISGAGVGGAAALGLLKMTDKLLQGEKFSSAAYAGAKTGAVAYGAGQIGKALQGAPGSIDNISWSKNGIPFSAQVDHGKVVGDIVMAGQTISPTDPNYAEATKAFLSAAGKEGMLGSAKAVGGAAGQDFSGFKESRYVDRKLTVYTWALHESIGRPRGGVQLTNEGIGDMFKKAAGAVGNWARTKGKNLTTKVTADKLQSAWKKAGSPTDSDEVAQVLQQAGVSPEVINQIYTSMKIPTSTAQTPPENTDQVTTQAAGAMEPNPARVQAAPATTATTEPAAQPAQAVNPHTGAQSPATVSQDTDQDTDQATDGIGTKAGNVVGDLAKGAADAIKRGAFAPVGQSVADKGTDKNMVTIKDRYGKPTQYKKFGDQWVGLDNKPVDASVAAMLDKQAQETPTSPDYVGRRKVARNQGTPATTQPTATQPTTQPTATQPTTQPTATQPTTQPTAGPDYDEETGEPAKTPVNYGQSPSSYATPTYNVPTGVPNVTGTNPPVTSKNGATTVPGTNNTSVNYGQSPSSYSNTTAPTQTKYKPSRILNPNMDQFYADQRTKNQQQVDTIKTPVTSGKINKKPALEESSIDFSALLWDQIK